MIIIIIIVILLILYFYRKSREDFNNFKSITVTPQQSIYNNMTINVPSYKNLYYQLASNIANIYPISDVITRELTIDNIKDVEDNVNVLSFVQNDLLLNYYKEKKKDTSVRYITSFGYEQITLVTLADSKIKSWKDLNGKTVATLSKNTAPYKTLQLLLSSLRFTNKIVEMVYHYDDLYNALVKKTIDAFFITISNPDEIIARLTRNIPLNIIGTEGIDDNILDLILPYFDKTFIDTSEYKLGGIFSIKTRQTRISLICNKQQDIQLIYLLIKTIFNNFTYLKSNGNKFYKLKLLEFNPDGLYLDNDIFILHDGAEAFYREFNIINNNPSTQCVYKIGINKCTLDNLNRYRLL